MMARFPLTGGPRCVLNLFLGCRFSWRVFEANDRQQDHSDYSQEMKRTEIGSRRKKRIEMRYQKEKKLKKRRG